MPLADDGQVRRRRGERVAVGSVRLVHHFRGRIRLTLAVMLSLASSVLAVSPALAGFQPQQTFATGDAPAGIASADFNGDGKLDLAVSNINGSSLSVLLNTTPAGATTASFAAHQTFTVGNGPRGLAAADLNGDGKPDLAAANQFDNTVSVLLNTTPGGAAAPTFTAHQTFTVGSGPRGLVAADLDGDGKLDLATINNGSASVSVLVNTTASGAATPTFAAQQVFPTGTVPEGLAAGDLNGDGRPDLVLARSVGGGLIDILRNTTTGGVLAFAAAQSVVVSGSNHSVAVTDLDGDGRPDIAAVEISGTVNPLRNTTPAGTTVPTFAASPLVSTSSFINGLAAGDLNGDGRPDLASTGGASNDVSYLLNTNTATGGALTFGSETTLPAGSSSRAVVIADLNGDGKPDLAAANNLSDTVSVYLANASGSVQFTVSAITVAESAGTVTLTLTRTGSTDGQISALVSVSGGTATPGQDLTFASPRTVTWADGDGADKTLVVPITQDGFVEGNETVQFALSLPATPFGATLGQRTSLALTIVDSDSPAPPPDDADRGPGTNKDTDRARRPSQLALQQQQHTNTSNLDQYRTEGHVASVERSADGSLLLVTIALGRGETLVIEVRCSPEGCPDIRPGDYVEADGEQGGRDEGGRFIADGIEITRNGRRVR